MPTVKVWLPLVDDVNVSWMKDCPLAQAAARDNMGIVDALLAKGAQVNPSPKYSEHTPLYLAAKMGHCNMVAKLLRAGANPDGASLEIAAWKSWLKIVGLLIEYGAELTPYTANILSDMVVMSGEMQILVQILPFITRPANVLFRAAIDTGKIDVIYYLLNKGFASKADYDHDFILTTARSINKACYEYLRLWTVLQTQLHLPMKLQILAILQNDPVSWSTRIASLFFTDRRRILIEQIKRHVVASDSLTERAQLTALISEYKTDLSRSEYNFIINCILNADSNHCNFLEPLSVYKA